MNQTAEILRKTYKMDIAQVSESANLVPMGFADRLIEEILANHADARRIALVGHEPSLSQLISILTSGEPISSSAMTTVQLAVPPRISGP